MRGTIASLEFALRSAIQNFSRNLWLSVAGVVTMAFILVSVGLIMTVSHSVGSLVDQQKAHTSKLQVYVQDAVSQASIANYEAQLATDPRVASIGFTNKDQALAQSKARGDNYDSALQLIGANVLPASIDVTTKKLDYVPQLASVTAHSPLVDTAGRSTDYNADVTNKLLTISNVVTLIGSGSSLMFGFISTVIIMVTIRTAVFVRRTEIEIMKLVGATDWFVRWPFILEGIVSGLIAAIVSVFTLTILYRLIIGWLQRTIFSVPYDAGFLALLLLFTVAIGAILGGLGSYLGVRRFLSV